MKANEYPLLPREVFDEMITTDRGLHELHYSIGFNDGSRSGRFVFTHRSCGLADRCEITEDMQQEAHRLYEARQAELLREATEVGTLALIGMGSASKASYDGEFENCRVHLVFTNNDGHKYSAEIHPGRNGFSGDFYDQTKYEQDDAQWEANRAALIAKYGSTSKIPMAERHKIAIPSHPFNNVRYESTDKLTYDEFLAYINKTYGCSYKRIRLYNYMVRDIVSHCVDPNTDSSTSENPVDSWFRNAFSVCTTA